MICSKRSLYRYFTLLLIGIMLSTSYPVSRAFATGGFAGGDGTSGSPYLIEDAAQMEAISNEPWAHYKLIGDIDLSSYANADGGRGWKPINGNFRGVLDGDGHKITGLVINRADEDNMGLFNTISGTVMNLFLPQARVYGQNHVGILAAVVFGATLNDVFSSGEVFGNQAVGGLVGDVQNSNLTHAGSTVDVTGTASDVGGLMGTLYQDNPSSYAISNSFAEGNVQGSGSNGYTGGLAGSSLNGHVEKSYASGNVIGAGDNSIAGGLAGATNYGIIEDSYALGSVKASGYAGGMIGYIAQGSVSNSYSSGKVTVTGGSWKGGGIGGYIYNPIITQVVWDMTTFGHTNGFGYIVDSSGATGLNSEDMGKAASLQQLILMPLLR